MAVDAPSGLWAVVVPTGTTDTNLCSNPSFEVGTTGWTTTSATLTRTAGAGQFGAYGGRLLASATNGKAGFTTGAVSSGASVPLSLWVKADSALVSLKGTIGASNTSQAHPGDGAWHRLSVVVIAPSATTPVLEVIDGRSSAWTNVDIDGAQIETGQTSPTTYLDGDQDGCVWTGAAHASTSTRDGRDPNGGALTSFDSLGLFVREQQGVGVPPVEVSTQGYAFNDGSAYLRSLVKERVITLATSILYPTGLIGELHTARLPIIAALNIDKRNGRGPIWLRYGGASTPKRIACYYQSGLDMDKVQPTVDEAELRFLASDPYYYGETESQATLSAAQSLTNTQSIAQRLPDGTWSNMAGGLVNAAGGLIRALALGTDRKIYVGGDFTNSASAAGCSKLAVWDPVTSTWAAVGGVNPNNSVYGIAVAPSGTVAIVGTFTAVGAVANTLRVATWNGSAWSALGTGAGASPTCCTYDHLGRLWIGGSFTTVGGVTTTGAAYWDGSWHAASLAGATFYGLRESPAGNMFAVASVAGVAGLYWWTGAVWSLLATATGGSATLSGLEWGADSFLYTFGFFTTFGGVSAPSITKSYLGTNYQGLETGLGDGAGYGVADLSVGPNGQLYAAGSYTRIGTITAPTGPVAVWKGSKWVQEDLVTPNGSVGHPRADAILAHPDGTLTVGLDLNGGTVSLTIPSVVTVTNPGSALAFPIITITANGYIYSLVNLTTGQALRFGSTTIFTGEPVTVDLRPGEKTITSPTRNWLSSLEAGSNLVSFSLAPGANRIVLFTSDGSAVTTLRFRARSLSPD